MIGDALHSRADWRRATEVGCAVAVLNRMLELGGPKYVPIAWERMAKGPSVSAADPCNKVMSRLKRLGERLWACDPARHVAEVQIRCAILNTFNCLGMPDTTAIV